MKSPSTWQHRQRCHSGWRIPVFLLFITLLLLLRVDWTNAASASRVVNLQEDGQDRHNDWEHREEPIVVASICTRKHETTPDGRIHPAMAYIYNAQGSTTTAKRKACASESSKIRLEYFNIPPNHGVNFQLLQKGCAQPFSKGREPFRMGKVGISPASGSAFVELLVFSGVILGSSSSVADFCLSATLSGERNNAKKETNVSVRISYRATRHNTKHGRLDRHSTIFLVVEGVTLEEANSKRPSHHKIIL